MATLDMGGVILEVEMYTISMEYLSDSDSGPGQQLHTQYSPGERNGKLSRNSKLGHSYTKVTKSRLYDTLVVVLMRISI